jgi:putative DNA methylase
MSYPIKSPRKLIEVALPLDSINLASVREKAIRHGHPSTLHLWWARRPLAAARAVIFAQLVNDPGYQQGGGFRYGVNKKDAAIERKRLFKIIEDLVLWENTTNEEVLERANIEIMRSWREVCELNKNHPQAEELFNPEKIPSLHDPFGGGGTIPLEAQRLGLGSYASDLNPVAVLINKAMIEIPPKFMDMSPVNPEVRAARSLAPRQWRGSQGLAEDVRYYGEWVRDQAEQRLGDLYPSIKITEEMVGKRPDLQPLLGQKLKVIAWLWARTVKSPNPAFAHISVPLITTFMLSTKLDREAFVEPVTSEAGYCFDVRVGRPKDAASAKAGTKATRGNFRCLISGAAISSEYIRSEGMAGRIGSRMMAIVADGGRGRIYLAPTQEMERIAEEAIPTWKPDVEFFQQALGFRIGNYGLSRWSELFTNRQLVAMAAFSDLALEAREKVLVDATAAGQADDGKPLCGGGMGATAYADAIAVYLGMFLSRLIDLNNAFCQWRNDPAKQHVGHMFSRQAISMVWDYAEANPIGNSAGSFNKTFGFIPKVFPYLPSRGLGVVEQADAAIQTISRLKIVSTDPPYYDNVGYADLSEFFYVWLRRTLKPIYPDIFSTLGVPKAEELVATAPRHGGRERAEAFFLGGMTQAMARLADQAHPAFPVTIYYAFKQSESDGADGTANTGWETFLDAVIRAGFALTGTWPMRTELANRMRGMSSNALASSIVLVCRKRAADSPTVSRREFLRELNAVLPDALDEMTKGSGDDRSPVAPVDLSQAIIGPGMAVYSKYAAVLEADGSSMSVRTALQLINRFLAEDDFDPDTQFCLHWFEQHGWGEGRFGEADMLSRAKGTSVEGVKGAGVISASGGIVRILKWSEYPSEWDPKTDTRNPVWETLHHLIRALKQDGESGAGVLLAAVKGKAESVRQLAYRLYTLCERQGWAEDARAYNELITSWTGIEVAAGSVPGETQADLFA